MHHDPQPALTDDETTVPARQMPLGIVVARILIVSGLGFSAAFAIFFLVGALWWLALLSIFLSCVFLVLMFAIERGAEGHVQ
jgi:hypothetical protein